MHKKFILTFVMLVFGMPGWASAETVWERFSEFDPDSNVVVNHEPLSAVLAQTVLPVGRSYRVMGDAKVETYRNSRIKTSANVNPSRYEGNRVLFHAFSDEHVDFFQGYQQGLENLSNRRPLSELNKNEQLAFWLNLHNVIVINKLIAEYPIKSLKSLKGSSKRKGFWDEKVTTIEGVPLSLTDIENIVTHNWDTSIVVYGLWQGSIGGPSLPYRAYNGKNVMRLLDDMGEEFVNSNRGAILKRGAIYASDFYEWVLPAFGNSEDEVLKHIKRYSDSRFHGDIENVTGIKFKYYDWLIADMLGGTLHTGGHNQAAGLLTARTGEGAAGPGAGGESGSLGNIGSAAGDISRAIDRELNAPTEMFPPAAMELLQGMYLNNRRPVYTPIITTEECGPDDDSCFGEQVVPDDGGDDSSDQ